MNKRQASIKNEIYTKPIFQAVTPSGHRFAVYPDGRTEGFPEGSFIINMTPLYSYALTELTKAEHKEDKIIINGVEYTSLSDAFRKINELYTKSLRDKLNDAEREMDELKTTIKKKNIEFGLSPEFDIPTHREFYG